MLPPVPPRTTPAGPGELTNHLPESHIPEHDFQHDREALRQLGREYSALQDQVRNLTVTPGTKGLDELASLLLTSQQHTTTAIERLRSLATSPYTAVVGSQAAIDALSAVVLSSALVTSDLAEAIADNAYDATGFYGPPDDPATVRRAQHAEALPLMAERLTTAADELDVAASGCAYIAAGIERDTTAAGSQQQAAAHEDQQPAVKITKAQYAALRSLASHGGTRYVRSQTGQMRAHANDGTKISTPTLNALDNRGLVHTDTSTSLFAGQALTVTAKGHKTLAHYRPAPAATSSLPPRVATTATARVRR